MPALILWSIPASSADAATAPFDSEYFGESAFLNVVPGQSYEFTVFFGNTGSTPWVRNTSTQVNLAICREDKVTCNVFSPWASWNDGWLSTIAYATHVQDTVTPGAVATFKSVMNVGSGFPDGIHIKQVDKEIIRQLTRCLSKYTML